VSKIPQKNQYNILKLYPGIDNKDIW